ncbi:cyclic nucleotide-binding domain-containing protein [Euhalothece natronophila Z-M001]|uniref:Cyclic nucleotide-binding domain-containing protein n=1 Tax=Euhalothece natronophila Z-M001 TaxID=522448 RepID=A0A5B8NT81_9CHRO|nr:SulP family inorganic anion transporter [Euhalothece natronophila]QDZ41250.1 cyclic nucleotide-binding domain-containing protein [Euhalothece natronophila Z-M001]
MTDQVSSRQQVQNNLLNSISETLEPRTLFLSLLAGLITGIIGVIRAISYAALIFSGALNSELGVGVGLTIFSTGMVSFMAAIFSALPGMIATPLAAPTAITAILANEIVQDLKANFSLSDIVITVLAAIALSSLLTGLFLLTLGKTKLGSKIRFIPYQVVGGFMAGTGWLLVTGSIQITTDIAINFQNLDTFFQADPLIHWGAALFIALILLFVSERYRHFLVMPGTLIGLIAGFYGVLLVTRTSLSQARVQGWLLENFPSGGLWQPLAFSDFGSIHWSAIASHWGLIISLMLVSLLSLVLSNSGIELVVGKDISLDQELESIGLANIASGFGTGMVGNQALPSTLLVDKIGARSRLSGISSGIFCFFVLVLGPSFISLFPKPILGGLILYLGLSLLLQWVYRAWFSLRFSDYLIVIVTLVVINWVGFLEGIAVGFVMSVISFMFNYSQINVVKNMTSLASLRSNIHRSKLEQDYLKTRGEKVSVLELRGYIFFGTADYLLRRVRDRVDQMEENPLSYILIDFREVEGLDASGVLTFIKLLKIARKRNLTLVYTNLLPKLEQQLRKGGAIDATEEDEARCKILPDLDRGLEWCENQLLKDIFPQKEHKSLKEQLTNLFLTSEQAEEFIPYLKPKQVEAGEVIFEAGAKQQCLYFVESGQVSVLLELPNGQTKRLQTHSEGAILGEMRFYGKPPLSSLVSADSPSQLYQLDRATFETMKQESPHLAYALQEYIVRFLCDSLTRREEQVRIIA